MPRTPRLTDLQLILLTTAGQRPDGSLLQPPTRITEAGDRIRKAVTSLVKRGLAEEAPISGAANAWRSEGDGHIEAIISDVGAPLWASHLRDWLLSPQAPTAAQLQSMCRASLLRQERTAGPILSRRPSQR